jgi:hypothetical protein
MMTKLLGASQLAAQPTGPTELPTQFPIERAAWIHVVNLSPYVFEIQDDQGLVRSVVSAFRERAVRLKARTDRVMLVATATETASGTLPTSAYAVYVDVVNQQPLMVGLLV